eukprot:jgi/Tetstr1/448639/TSEL_035884.t1
MAACASAAAKGWKPYTNGCTYLAGIAASILRACTMRAFSARNKVITAKQATMCARATVKAAAGQAASGVSRAKFTREHKSKHKVPKHVDAMKVLGMD